ncbi:hypothetical protein E5082_28420 [Streptomyces griseoluteus]|uniref:Uncharacterized protein n=1 Tax=Streptomyces griseoluteus TaxID=29306 RepID=A0A4Z1D426_STRGP|nr:hypothetical protein [Streptomyces griseoluteus]TGN76130.1 hypothetical protein E5082_28420 [Streptomyces griseoluteus]GHE93290.1 hypothetical protein GCM10017776_07240 [Streptomyces griseoluteus]
MVEQATTEQTTPDKKPLGTASVFLSFVPWIIFGVVASPSTWEYAALLLSAQDLLQGRIRILDAAGIVFFAVLSVLALALNRADLLWLETYAQVISNGLVAVIAFASLLHDPFTAQYARESTPRQYWDSPVFRHINRVLTTYWGVTFAVMTASTWLAIHFPGQDDWFNWVIPVVLLVIAVKFTQRYPETYKSRAVPAG